MKKLFVSGLFSLSLLLFACGQSPLEAIDGTWSIDTSGASAKSSDPEEAEILREMLQHIGAVQVKVDSKQKKMTVAAAGFSESGNFTVVSESAEAVTLNVEGTQYVLEIKGSDSLVFKGEAFGRRGLPMKRAK